VRPLGAVQPRRPVQRAGHGFSQKLKRGIVSTDDFSAAAPWLVVDTKPREKLLRESLKKEKPKDETEISEIDAAPLSKELKKRWSHFIRKVYETDPLTCPKCQGEMRIISFIDQPDIIKKFFNT